MRPYAGVLLLGLTLPACHPPRSDAEHYVAALAAEDFSVARAACRRIRDREARDDCYLAALEAHHRLSEEDCAEIQSPRWSAECLFQLAERQSAAGDLDLALLTCERSRFARFCAWHLLQDEVQAGLDEPVDVAEARVDRFRGARAIPDALHQFWLIRFREQGAAGETLDEADCEDSRDPVACRHAVEDHVRRVMDALGKASRHSTCLAEPGQRATTRGGPAWKPGPVANAAEARWVAERCP